MKWRKGPRVYNEGEVAVGQAAAEAIDRYEDDKALAMLAAAGLTIEDLTAMDEAGLIKDPVIPVEEPVAEGPAAPPLSVVLPDGTDLTDRRVQTLVEERVVKQYGPHAVVAWPRYPDVEDGVDAIVPIVLARPESTGRIPLGEGVKPTDAPRVAAHLSGQDLDLVEFAPRSGYAVGARLTPSQRTIRDRLATLIQRPSNPEDLRPWEVEVAVHHVVDHEVERLDQVVILRMPEQSADAEKRAALLRSLVATLPGGSNGWEVIDDLITGRARLRFGKPRTLPGTVAMADLLPPALDTSTWHKIPLGIDPEGRQASVDLTAGPHCLIVGPTGSGKSVYLRQHAMSALARGHQLVVIDPIKSGLDFMAFRPWCVAFGDDGIEQARTIIEAVYAEGMRRKSLLRAYEAPSWIDLPPEVRQRENVKPLTVVFDEFMSAVIASPVPKGLDKDDPLVEEANRINAAKAVILAMVGKAARELRFVGVFLCVAMQRPDASLLAGFGEIRSNLTSAAQLIKPGSLPAQETLRMVFPGDQTHVATEAFMELDDGASKGLAAIAADGGDVQGFRVGFGAPAEIPEMLDRLGVPRVTPWELDAPEKPDEPWKPIEGGPKPSQSPTPVRTAAPNQVEVHDIGEFTFSLDDLEAADSDDRFTDFDESDFVPVPPAARGPLDDLWD